MKYTIAGFSQPKLVELKLDIIDAYILRWFVDFLPKMTQVVHDGRNYYWVQYQAVIDDLPAIGIENRQVVARRFDKLISANVMAKHVNKSGGNFTTFRLSDNYMSLVETPFNFKVEGSTPESTPIDLKVDTPIDLKVDTKDSSIKQDSSINNKEKIYKKEKSEKPKRITSNFELSTKDQAFLIIDYFNQKTGKIKYQSGSDRQAIIKYVTAMLRSGDTLDDIKLLIDHKLANPNTKLPFELGAWINTKYAGDNLAKAKTWHMQDRPKISLYDPNRPALMQAKIIKSDFTEYIVPDSQDQKKSLATYIQRCYRDNVNPKTKEKLTEQQQILISRHKAKCKRSASKSWYQYIYDNEVLTYRSLLEQNVTDAEAGLATPTARQKEIENSLLSVKKHGASL